ncbi:MAG: hypothetical protein WCG85_06005 [Polyangia bacterium]|jgi:hypothetical protein
MDNELGYGSTRLTIDWSPDNRMVALMLTFTWLANVPMDEST